MQEHYVDLIDLFVDVLKHWKGAILFFCIGAVCFGIYSYSNGANAQTIEKTAMTSGEKRAVDIVMEYEDLYNQASQLEDIDVENLISLKKAMIDAVRGFNDAQMEYYAENSTINILGTQSSLLEVTEEESTEKHISKKMVCIGAIVGAFLYFFIWGVKYIFDEHLKSSDDLMEIISVPQLGKVYTVKMPPFFIDRFLFKIKYHGQNVYPIEKSIELIVANLCTLAKGNDCDLVTLVGVSLGDKAIEICEQIKKIAKNSYEIDVDILDNLLVDTQDISSLYKATSVVMVEEVGKTLYSDINKEQQLINQLNINILGGISVE